MSARAEQQTRSASLPTPDADEPRPSHVATRSSRPSVARIATMLSIVVLASACGGDVDDAPIMTNAGIRQLVRDQWAFGQDVLQACMDEAGFEWTQVPFDDSALLLPTGDDPDARVLDVTMTADDAKRDGFGVVAGLGDTVADAVDDPNSGYTSGLSPAEYSAYTLALDAEGGCREQADAAAQAEFADRQLELTQSFDQLQSYIQGSEEFRRIRDEWSACMAGRGWDGAELTEFDQRIREDLDQQLQAVTVVSEETGEGVAPARQVPTAELERLRQYEIGAAISYVECFDPHREAYGRLVDAAYATL